MSDETAPAAEQGLDADAEDGAEAAATDAIPDESTLMGKTGVEAEVLAELARAEAKMSDPSAPDDPDAAGAQV